MKKALVLFLFLQLLTTLAYAQEAKPNNKTVGSDEKLAAGLQKNALLTLSSKMCAQLQSSLTMGHEDVGDRLENLILTHLGITRKTKGYKLLVANFWNANSQDLICNDDAPNMRNPQHFMKRVVEMNMQNEALYDFILYDPEEYPITVNHIEIYNGKKETILDYIENILTTPGNDKKYNFQELQMLKITLVEDYDAKQAKDLDPSIPLAETPQQVLARRYKKVVEEGTKFVNDYAQKYKQEHVKDFSQPGSLKYKFSQNRLLYFMGVIASRFSMDFPDAVKNEKWFFKAIKGFEQLAEDNPESAPIICFLALSLDEVGEYNPYDSPPTYDYPDYDKRALEMYNKCENLGGLNDELKTKKQSLIKTINEH